MKRLISSLYIMIGCTLVLSSCNKEQLLQSNEEKTFTTVASLGNESQENTFKGPEVVVGNGYARSFITISNAGEPQELGIIFTNEALSGLPTVNTPYVLELHNKALESTPFEHVSLGWSANGHPLPNSFIAPHFDVRFFMMSLAERLAIPAPPSPGFTNLPPTGYMPANYFPDAPVPQLGLHWTDKSFTAGIPVNHTLILGSFDGAFTFVSPIVVRTDLVSGQSFSISYAQPQSFARHSYYPTKYNVYQDDKQRHYVTLSDFIWR
jgi:Domain of unknown function (DUF5602)